jgi:hypothetical protein
MNSTEPLSNTVNTSEDFRSVQQSSEGFSDLQSTSKRAGGVGRGKKYFGAEVPAQDIGQDYLIMEEAYTIFEHQGERRSVRMIAEYCKTGELICSYDSDDKRWHITKDSVDSKIAKIKALNARKAAASPQSTSEVFTDRPAAPEKPAAELPPREAAPPSSAEIKKLEQDILDLKIMNKGKDYLIEQLREERKEFITRIETGSRLIGSLKSQLLRLMPGRRSPDTDAVIAASHTVPNPPGAQVAPEALILDNDDDSYDESSADVYAEENVDQEGSSPTVAPA